MHPGQIWAPASLEPRHSSADPALTALFKLPQSPSESRPSMGREGRGAGFVYIGHEQRGRGSQVLLLLASAHSHPHLALPALRPFDTGKDFEKFKYVLSFGPSAKEFQF